MKCGSLSRFFLQYTTQVSRTVLHRQRPSLSLHQISSSEHHGTSGFGAFPQALPSPEWWSVSVHIVLSYSSFRTWLKSHSSRKLARIFAFLDHKFFFLDDFHLCFLSILGRRLSEHLSKTMLAILFIQSRESSN